MLVHIQLETNGDLIVGNESLLAVFIWSDFDFLNNGSVRMLKRFGDWNEVPCFCISCFFYGFCHIKNFYLFLSLTVPV